MRTQLARARVALGAVGLLAGPDREQVGWAVRRHAPTAYLGWVGRGNLGDEAMYSALSAASSAGRLRTAPLHAAARAVARGAKIDTLVLGGGTLIGRDEWASRLDALLKTARVNRLIVLGTGCEDIDRALHLGIATDRGLRMWSGLLARADQIGVRGPDSRESLGRLGIEAQVVGDLGLLADRLEAPAADLRGSRLGVSVAAVRDGLGADRPRQLDVLRSAVSRLATAGFDPVWFCMDPDDEPLARRLASAGEQVRPFDRDLGSLLSFLDGCAVVLSERLHGGILALARGVPAVIVGYKPKSLDFARSVGWEDHVVDLEAVDPQAVSELVIGAASRPLPTQVLSRMDGYRAQLAERLRAVTSG